MTGTVNAQMLHFAVLHHMQYTKEEMMIQTLVNNVVLCPYIATVEEESLSLVAADSADNMLALLKLM